MYTILIFIFIILQFPILGANTNLQKPSLHERWFTTTDTSTLLQILQNGSDINQKNNQGFTRLHLETELHIKEFLLKHGANPIIKAPNGFNALEYQFLNQCTVLNHTMPYDSKKKQVVHRPVNKNLLLIERLVKSGIPFSQKNPSGEYWVNICTFSPYLELLHKKWDFPQVTNTLGQSTIDIHLARRDWTSAAIFDADSVTRTIYHNFNQHKQANKWYRAKYYPWYLSYLAWVGSSSYFLYHKNSPSFIGHFQNNLAHATYGIVVGGLITKAILSSNDCKGLGCMTEIVYIGAGSLVGGIAGYFIGENRWPNNHASPEKYWNSVISGWPIIALAWGWDF